MRRILSLTATRLVIAVTVFLISCTSGTHRPEKAIGDFVQTDKGGTWTDMQFKVLELGAPRFITMADSICILTDVFEADRRKKVDFATRSLERNRQVLEKENFASMREFYRENVDRQQRAVDSLSALKAPLPSEYSMTDLQKVLAQEILCRFSIMSPLVKARQELTETFVLNADGSKCYRHKSKKKY